MSVRRKEIYRRRRFWALAVAVIVTYLVVELLSGGGLPSPPPPGVAPGAVAGDPFAYTAAAEQQFATRAMLGNAQVLFLKSPGGIMATAARVASYRNLIDNAVRGTKIPASLLEGVVFLESAGRAQVIAGNSAADAAGLTQILAGTGKTMLGMHINLRRSQKLTNEIGAAQAAGDSAKVTALESQRAKIDPRFNPVAELAATVRYLKTAERSLGGRADLAIAAYHAGIANLQQILTLYDGGRAVPYPQLYFDSSPTLNPGVLASLETLPDDGGLYYWRVLAAEHVMALWRGGVAGRARLRRWAQEEQGFPSGALTLTAGVTHFSDPAAVANAYHTKPAELVPLPRNSSALHLSYAPSLGSMAAKVGAPPAIYRGLRPAALRMLIQMVAWVDALAKTDAAMIVTNTVRDPRYNAQVGFDSDPPAATGYTFDIERTYATLAQRQDFQFVLDRLQDLNLIAWTRGTDVIEITVAPDAESVLEHGV